MLRRIARATAMLGLALGATFAVLYWGFGVRVQLDGSGMPRLREVTPPERAAARIEADRAAQRAHATQGPEPSAQSREPGAPSPEPSAQSPGPRPPRSYPTSMSPNCSCQRFCTNSIRSGVSPP